MQYAEELEEKLIGFRRDFHRYPETGWTEFRTASIVIERLGDLGYDVAYGAETTDEKSMMGVPDAASLSRHMERAAAQGANPALVEKMAGGKTGVVGTMRFSKEGPTVALRFDMDCNDIDEAPDKGHRPAREGFASVNPGCMHACGHDGHTANGLAVAEILSAFKSRLRGAVKLIFQPAEEGVRGAKAMVEKGVVDDADYLIGSHTLNEKIGFIACGVNGLLATSKFDAVFTGLPAHAGQSPHAGRNSLAAAATAALNLLAVSRHGDGASRINVGVLNAGSGRNVIPASALLKIETRGETCEIDRYMVERAENILRCAAQMYDNQVEIRRMGSAVCGVNSPGLTRKISGVASRLGIFDRRVEALDVGGSEDCSYFMRRVQQNGGQAAYLMAGASCAAPAHTSYFDLDERALVCMTKLLAALTAELLTGK